MTAPRLAILTGRSDPARTGLSQAQSAFLAAVAPAHVQPVQDGFPWTGGVPERPVPLLAAAWRNARAWQGARRGASRAGIAPPLAALAAGGTGPLAIITASCGLDMLACGWREDLCQLVIALGPVTPGRPSWPGVRLVTITGQRDLLARSLHRPAPDIRVPCHHMGYWSCPATRRAVAGLLRDWPG